MMNQKISLPIAILININIVIGSAFFINAPEITKKVGIYSPLVWFFVGIILLPLMFVFAFLSKEYPFAGGMYTYSSRALNKFWGFFSGWSYFIGTAAGNALVIHAFAKLITEHFYIIKALNCPPFFIDLFFILIFAFFNLFNLELLGKLQVFFTAIKIIPFVLIFISALFTFDTSSFNDLSSFSLSELTSSIPLVFFAFIGLEACCAIGHAIENSKKNTSKAIFISFAFIMLIYCLAQFLLTFTLSPDSLSLFDIVNKLPFSSFILDKLKSLLFIALLFSYLGGFYSMFYANNWTLFAMAKEKAIPFAFTMEKMNKFGTPKYALYFQTLLIISFLLITSNIEYLTSMSDFGVAITYLLSVLSFFIVRKNASAFYKMMGIFSFISCGFLLFICLQSLLATGFYFVIPFVLLISFGFIGFLIKNHF